LESIDSQLFGFNYEEPALGPADTEDSGISALEFLPDFSAARAIPDLATLILSAYCNGIRVDFHPPA
jgi:hypothetical protein